MNENTKTGTFCGIAVVSLILATVITWPTSEPEEFENGVAIDQPLFPEFKDPLAAARLKIVTFNEEQGSISNFEVLKNSESGEWTIVSNEGYPADAVSQMKNAANALVDLKVLDSRQANVEDHKDYGVIEPILEELSVGDEGVGKLVTFEDGSKKTLASIIIGDRVKDTDDQVYVRVSGQDPVYAVSLDESQLTTNFRAWIEEDLLQLSSIDIQDLQIKDYSTELTKEMKPVVSRNYDADLTKSGTRWNLDEVRDYDPQRPNADPTIGKAGEGESLNAAKVSGIERALDDLRIVDVVRKPDGMSANLKANRDLLSNKEAIGSLARRGFYLDRLEQDGELEILSANGELVVGLTSGIEYVLRYGNISGVSSANSSDDENAKTSRGVNRYLLVTTRVNESKFPAPDLRIVPQSLEELAAMDSSAKGKSSPTDESPKTNSDPKGGAKKGGESQDDAKVKKDESKEKAADSDVKESNSSDDESNRDKSKEVAEEKTDKSSDGEPVEDNSAEDASSDDVSSGETKAEGSGSASETGQAAEPLQDKDAEDKDAEDDDKSNAKEDSEANEAKTSEDEETEEEKQERLEAAQEKIVKDNTRKLNERRDRLKKAENAVRALNARFADWYYVIPEDTYAKLTIQRSELFSDTAATTSAPGGKGPLLPQGRPPLNPAK